MVALCLVAFLVPCSVSAAENLLANGSFETQKDGQTVPEGWTQLRGNPVEVKADGGRTGEVYLRFSDPDAEHSISVESTHVPARPGGTYTAGAWFRTADNCAPGVYVQFHDVSGERITETHARAQGPTEGWVEARTVAVCPEDAAEVSVLLYAYTADTGQFDADDVALSVEGGTDPFAASVTAGNKTPVDIGSRRELFIDDFMLDGTSGDVRRLLHHPVPREVVLSFDAPWEGAVSFYVTVFQDEDKVRMYYRGAGNEGLPEVACMAESTDGIVFTRPVLGIHEVAGSKDNNVIWMGHGAHNLTPFKDPNPDCTPEQRYKALAGGPLLALASADGVHWSKMAEEPVITDGAFDSQNLAFYDELRGEYVAFFRDFTGGVRTVKTCTSRDFLNWTEPQWCQYGDAPPTHLYTNATIPYFRAPHIYLSFPKRFIPSRKKQIEHKEVGLSDCLLLSSRNGVDFDMWQEAFLRPGPDPNNWTERNMGTAYGMVALSAEEISLYWVENYRHPTCRLRRGTLRTDGFVSLNAGVPGGQMLTRPFTFTGSRLLVNYSTSAAGFLRFELTDEAGRPLPDFAMARSETLYGDEIEHEVSWGEGADLEALAGQVVRLRVAMRDADLYALQFAP